MADAILNSILQTRMDGVILTPPVSDSRFVRAALTRKKIPHVLVSPPKLEPGVGCVHMDNRQAAYDITSYLVSLGHRRIAFVKGHPRHGAAQLRLQGYLDALKDAGIEPDETLIRQGNFRFQTGAEAAEQLLSLENRPTAIMAANDEMSAGVMAAAHRLEVAMPGALSVAGFDDVPYASITWPALTTIRQPIAEMGAAAAGLLLKQILSKDESLSDEAGSILFPYELKIRGSTGPAPKP
jgi:LacI family transcriptional regulator